MLIAKAADYEQMVAEVQALQAQVKNLLDKLNITPVVNPTFEEIQAGIMVEADKRYLSVNAPVAKNPLPRIPNTFIWINELGLGVGLTSDQVLTWVFQHTDKRYKPISFDNGTNYNKNR